MKNAKTTREAPTQKYNNTYGHEIAVMGMYDVDSREVRAMVVPNVRRATFQKEIFENIEFGSNIHTVRRLLTSP